MPVPSADDPRSETATDRGRRFDPAGSGVSKNFAAGRGDEPSNAVAHLSVQGGRQAASTNSTAISSSCAESSVGTRMLKIYRCATQAPLLGNEITVINVAGRRTAAAFC
jgi:hypothetical protein